MFKDRKDAGIEISYKLEKFKDEDVIILMVPRGGVEVAYESIKRFNFKWDLIITRKIGIPYNKEVAIGAVDVDGYYFVDESRMRMLGITDDYIREEVSKQADEIKRRLREYRNTEKFPDVNGKTVIVIDDGIATGFTIIAAIKSIRNYGAKKIVLAVPVAPRDMLKQLEEITDEVICLYSPEEFYAVGMHYENFSQVSDEEVFEIINKLRNSYPEI